MNWVRQSWFRHPLSLRPESGSMELPETGWLFAKGAWGFPMFYTDWDAHWHASNRHFLGFVWFMGVKVRWLGLTDTN